MEACPAITLVGETSVSGSLQAMDCHIDAAVHLGYDRLFGPGGAFGLALSVLPDPAWDAISPERPLRFWRLIEITQRPGDGLIAAALRADERIVNYIKGHNYLDDRLAPLVSRLDSVKFAVSSGVYARTGNGFDAAAVTWQHRWGGGL